MKVIASKDWLVPMEGQPRRYIGAQEAVSVEDSAYYRRQIADGDLLVLDELAEQVSAAAEGVAASVPPAAVHVEGSV